MALRHGRNARIYVNGVDISGDLNAINPTSEQELADVSVFGNVGHSLYPGLAKDVATIEAVYNDTEKGVFEGMIQATPASTSYGMMITFGQSVGDPAYATEKVVLKSNAIKSVVTDVNRASINIEASQFPFQAGVLLSEGKQTVAAGSSGYSTTLVDNLTASGTTGGAAYLQVFSVVGGTLTVTIEQSPIGLWTGEQSTLVVFTAASSSETQHIPISSQILRYTRAYWVGATSTSQFATTLTRY